MRTDWILRGISIVALLLITACGTVQQAGVGSGSAVNAGSDSTVDYRIILVGDAGPDGEYDSPMSDLLAYHLEEAGSRSSVVFLGDRLPCCFLDETEVQYAGLPEIQQEAPRRAFSSYQGRVILVPGEHDGSFYAPEVEAIADASTPSSVGQIVAPTDHSMEPIEIELTGSLTLILLNTREWFRDEGDEENVDMGQEQDGDFLVQLDDLIKRNRKKDLIVVGHHPIRSQGIHGGHFPLRYHLFPLTARFENAYLPLPLIGSAYPLYRRFVGNDQDLAASRYQILRRGFSTLFRQHENLIYASGHDRSLQHLPDGKVHHIISGAGENPEYVAKAGRTGFSRSATGIAIIEYHRDGSIWLDMKEAVPESREGNTLYRVALREAGPLPTGSDDQIAGETFSVPEGATRQLAVNPSYEAGGFKTFFLGSQHRKAWTTPVTVPVLDMSKEAGGLTPIELGGGMQTLSLQLLGADGHEYVLRSIDKDPTKTVPEDLRETVALDIIQDQISSLHPFGAFVVPRLAEAAGVYHTNPKIVFVPDDPRLGIYRAMFAGQIMMFEERPDGDVSDMPSFGRSKNVIGSEKLYEKLNKDNDNRIDQRAFARARLLDFLISDWDRHRDQFRWAEFENPNGKGHTYRPIPRDRDWAFNRMNGVFPSLVQYVMPKFQDFHSDYGSLKGLTKNGMEQDRRFTSMLTRQDWIEIADSVKAALTDDVIDEALLAWPESIWKLYAPEFGHLLRVRRDKLPELAEDYYDLYARVVDVVTSDKHERFEVIRKNNDETEVVVYKTTKEGQVSDIMYRRTFYDDETDEVRLYGLGGNDQFEISGEVNEGILITAVGGPGDDVFVDRSRVKGVGKKGRFYDMVSSTKAESNGETRIRLSHNPLVNEYDSWAYKHDLVVPLTYFGSNRDDGVYVGGGFEWKKHGFRKDPYANLQRFRANFAARTLAFNVVYDGLFVSVLGGWDVHLSADLLAPRALRNYYGMGNETLREGSSSFYEARITQFTFLPTVEHNIGEGIRFAIGPKLEVTKTHRDGSRFIGMPISEIGDEVFQDQWYAGAETALSINTVDNKVNPKYGYKWEARVGVHYGLRHAKDDYTRAGTELVVYFSQGVRSPITLAVRVGAEHVLGSMPYYAASTLGGKDNLRGYRSTRFSGRSSVFQNVELRARLFGFSTYLLGGEIGILGFLDNGRVWADHERSRVWHQGYGGGLWMGVFNRAILTGTMDFSNEEQMFTLRLGFFY